MPNNGNRRRNKRRGKSGNRASTNPTHLAQDLGGQGYSVRIPRRDYLNYNIGGVQPSLRRTLTFCSFTDPSTATFVYSENLVLKLNSPYDPDNAVGGLSAVGFAKYMAFYSKCFVTAARITVKHACAPATGSGFAPSSRIVGVTISTNTTGFSNALTAINNGLCDYTVQNSMPDSGVLTVGVDISKFLDKPDVLDDNQLFCTSSTDPLQLVVAHVWVFNSGNTALSLSAVAEVEMDCVFTDPIPFT